MRRHPKHPRRAPDEIQRAMSSGAAAASSSSSVSNSTPLLATGDWTKNLVHLAKTAELKFVFLLVGVQLRVVVLAVFDACMRDSGAASSRIPFPSHRLSSTRTPARFSLVLSPPIPTGDCPDRTPTSSSMFLSLAICRSNHICAAENMPSRCSYTRHTYSPPMHR